MRYKVNVYSCPDHHHTVTIDRDPGRAPFIIACPHPDCQGKATIPSQSGEGTAQSSSYNVPQWLRPEYEWIQMENKEPEHLSLREIPPLFPPSDKPSSKPSHDVLPAMLEKRNGADKYKILILMAKAWALDDQKFDLIPSPIQERECPKMALRDILVMKHPELSDIAHMIVEGKFDDQCDGEDLERMRGDMFVDGMSIAMIGTIIGPDTKPVPVQEELVGVCVNEYLKADQLTYRKRYRVTARKPGLV